MSNLRFVFLATWFVLVDTKAFAAPSGTYDLKAESSEDRGVYTPDGTQIPPCTDDEAGKLAEAARGVQITWDQKKAMVNREEWSLRVNREKVMIRRPGTAPGRLVVVFWLEKRSPRGVIAYWHMNGDDKPSRGCSLSLHGRWRKG